MTTDGYAEAGTILHAWQQIARLVDREDTSPASVVDRVAYLITPPEGQRECGCVWHGPDLALICAEHHREDMRDAATPEPDAAGRAVDAGPPVNRLLEMDRDAVMDAAAERVCGPVGCPPGSVFDGKEDSLADAVCQAVAAALDKLGQLGYPVTFGPVSSVPDTAPLPGYGAGWDAGYAAGVANTAPDDEPPGIDWKSAYSEIVGAAARSHHLGERLAERDAEVDRLRSEAAALRDAGNTLASAAGARSDDGPDTWIDTAIDAWRSAAGGTP